MEKYLYPANILIPKENFDKWAVIACDQYTSDKKYWEEVENIKETDRKGGFGSTNYDEHGNYRK